MTFERAVRMYARKFFGARMAHDASKHLITTTTRKSAVMEITNPAKVLERLQATFGKPVTESRHAHTFKVGKKGTITVRDTGELILKTN